jgi:hypothetical protein
LKAPTASAFTKKFKIFFVGEEAQDAGGVFKEWIFLVLQEIFTGCVREKEPMLREESEEMKTLQKNRSFAKTQKDTKKFKKSIGHQVNNDESLRNHSEICSMVSEDNY